mmetsp:Transcript_21667/g.77183  ORF Transcript_21667/g.77183 Transcript_21667/m.77183 type:complete len:211 (+) Transcript_21667:3413-4045(+)
MDAIPLPICKSTYPDSAPVLGSAPVEILFGNHVERIPADVALVPKRVDGDDCKMHRLASGAAPFPITKSVRRLRLRPRSGVHRQDEGAAADVPSCVCVRIALKVVAGGVGPERDVELIRPRHRRHHRRVRDAVRKIHRQTGLQGADAGRGAGVELSQRDVGLETQQSVKLERRRRRRHRVEGRRRSHRRQDPEDVVAPVAISVAEVNAEL